MTAGQQEPERQFIISKSQLKGLCNSVSYLRAFKLILDAVRSCTLAEHDKQEREKVLDEALSEIKRVDSTGECVHPSWSGCCSGECTPCVVEFVINSLRAGKE